MIPVPSPTDPAVSGYGWLYRQWLYPAFDRGLKRRRTIDHWQRAEASQWWPREALQAQQIASLRTILRHAWLTCEYYRDSWKELGLSPDRVRSLDDFHAWPLLQRSVVRCQADRLRSAAPLQRMRKSTGGSSGQPLQFELDAESNERRMAMTHRGYGWAGGGPGSKQLYLWGDAIGPVPLWKRLKTNLHRRFDRQRFLSCFEFAPHEMKLHLRRFNRYRPEVLIAYTTPLYEFSRYLHRHAMVPWSPRSILVGAEKLYPFQRERIEQVFRSPVFETYGSREFMLIGAECERHAGLHLSMENLLVEILDDDGRPTPDGSEGNVVITDLFNRAMPFIRYVNGDRAVAGLHACDCGRGLPLLRQVVGRRLDSLYTPSGRIIPGEFFPHLVKDYPDISRFQVVQDAAGAITVKLVPESCGVSPETHQRLQAAICSQIGDAVPLTIEVVSNIPLTQAGKHRVVVRETSANDEAHLQACQ